MFVSHFYSKFFLLFVEERRACECDAHSVNVMLILAFLNCKKGSNTSRTWEGLSL